MKSIRGGTYSLIPASAITFDEMQARRAAKAARPLRKRFTRTLEKAIAEVARDRLWREARQAMAGKAA